MTISTLKRFSLGVLLGCAGFFMSSWNAHASPDIRADLRAQLDKLPFAAHRGELQAMVNQLKQTNCGGGLTGCYQTNSGPLHLYFFSTKGLQQTFLVVIDQQTEMPKLLKEDVQGMFTGTTLSSPIISISTTDFDLETIKMPPSLQKVVRESYFNMGVLSFSSGVQIAARADLRGLMKQAMESMGARTNDVVIRAAVVVPVPADLGGGGSFQKAALDAANPEAFVEIQYAPGSKIPLIMPPMNLTDASFFLNNGLIFGFKGNAAFKGVSDKTILTHFQTPLSPVGVMDYGDFSFRMATPSAFTLDDAAHVIAAMAIPDVRLIKHGGGFVRNIDKYKDQLLQVTKPLSVIQLRNPVPAPEYRFGDPGKPFPTDPKYFNIVLYGPTVDGGPWMHLAGDARVLGQSVGWGEGSAGLNGFKAKAGENIHLKLGPLGKVSLAMNMSVSVAWDNPLIGLSSQRDGQKINIGFVDDMMQIDVSASCINPFEIKTKLKVTPSTKLTDVFEAQGGVNVDPGKIPGCIGAELEAAYKKVAGEFSHLAGYSAKAANEELKKISSASAQAANEAAKQAQAEYNKAKDAARSSASKVSGGASKAFNDAGNAFKKLGGKKKRHQKGVDPKFASSVFDWDYYYDNAQDVVKANVDLSTHWRDYGFNEGRQGSPEFHSRFYWSRYSDIQALCPNSDEMCIVQHWLDYGIEQGRQGSAGFSVVDYLAAYPDLLAHFGPDDYEGAMDHWLNDGETEGRTGGVPKRVATMPINGPLRIGGGGGGRWTDVSVCRDGFVTGFRVAAGKEVNRLQFKYPSGWGEAHGAGNFNTEISLLQGQYIVRVDYRSGSRTDQITFITNTGNRYGPYGGGGGTQGTYNVTPGEKLGCMRGRSGSTIDQLTFTSTGLR